MIQPIDDFAEWVIGRFMENLAVRVGATEAFAYVVLPERLAQGPLRRVAHVRPGDADKLRGAAAARAFEELALPCVRQGRPGAIDVGDPSDSGDKKFCLIAPFPPNAEMRLILGLIVLAPDLEGAREKLNSVYGWP